MAGQRPCERPLGIDLPGDIRDRVSPPVEQHRECVGRGFGGGRLGGGLSYGVAPGGSVDRQHGPRTCAVLAAQLDVEARPVMFDAQPVRLVAVLVQDPSAFGIGHKRGPSTAWHPTTQPQKRPPRRDSGQDSLPDGVGAELSVLGSVGVECHHSHMQFTDQDLSGARFTRCLMPGAVIRGSEVAGMEIDDPNLHEGSLWVNGVDVVAFVEAELNSRFPGRELKTANTPEGLRTAWAAAEKAWASVLPTAAGLEDVSVDGEWSFSQTLRHLVMATNAWLHGAILGQEQPFHWIGQPFAEYEPEGGDMAIFWEPASYEEILAVRGEHQAMVREYLAAVTDEVLAETHPNPWAPEHRVTALNCLHVILNEEWEHQRYAVRDLRNAARG